MRTPLSALRDTARLQAYRAYVDSDPRRMMAAALICERAGLGKLARALREHVATERAHERADASLDEMLSEHTHLYDEHEAHKVEKGKRR